MRLCRKVWPEVEVICASEPIELADYIAGIGDPRLVLDMLVGDLQRVIEYPTLGFAIDQELPNNVRDAYNRLVEAGYTGRLMT